MENILPVNFVTLYIFAGAVLIEFIVFLLIVSRKKLNILRIFFAVLTGNALSTVFCMFLPAGTHEWGYYVWLGVAFLLAVIFEWLIDIAYFVDHKTVKNSRFLACSLFGNIITFLVIALLNMRGLI